MAPHQHSPGGTMTKIPALNGPLIGDRVRSFDFHYERSLEGPRSCYMEGQITGIEMVRGCWRYKIEVNRCVAGGKEVKDFARVIYPPINGTKTTMGRLTDGVELLNPVLSDQQRVDPFDYPHTSEYR